MKYVYIALAGMVGTSLRLCLVQLIPSNGFPYSILLANIISTFLLAVLYEHFRAKKLLPDVVITAIGTGLLGSFSTISSVANDTLSLATNGMYGLAIANYSLNMIICLLAAFIGLAFCKLFQRGVHK